MSHYPKGWADRGDLHSTKSHNPTKNPMHTELRGEYVAYVNKPEGGQTCYYANNVIYTRSEQRPTEGSQYIGIIYHTEGYPSGGSTEYVSTCYWHGDQVQKSREWRSMGWNLDNPQHLAKVEWYTVTITPADYSNIPGIKYTHA